MDARSTAQPTLHRTQANGISLASWEWRADLRGSAPSLLLVHATGFHGRVWNQTIARLPPRHVIAVEQRGHGRSEPAPFGNWDVFGHDLADFADAMDLQGAVAVGHSMGGHGLVQAAAYRPQRFARIVLVDPVLQEPEVYHLPPVPPGTLHPSAGRKARFDSPQAMFDRFADRVPYAVFERGALRDYCEHGLLPAPDGQGCVLACAPGYEGSVYPLARSNPGVYASIRALHIPVLVVRARAQDPSVKPWDPLGSPTWPGLAAEFRQGRDMHLTDKTHFLPMEDPALMARILQDEFAQLPS